MESQEFNLSVLENVTTFSTPLKNCLDYEALLSLIKEEIDISQTEDEADYQNRSNDAPRSRARRRESEFCDSDDKFKSPYRYDHSARSKSPRTASISRAKRRSKNHSKNDTRKHNVRRAWSLGRVMPGRSLKSVQRRDRSSICYSDTSGFSDLAENSKTSKRKSWTSREIFDYDIKNEYETEGEALAELLNMAQEQVMVEESPCGRNSTVSSQGESTSLATSDPLDTGAMEEDFYVESSQPVSVSNFRQELLNLRSICEIPKSVETIKRNLHFSDGQESEEETQSLSLTLSPEPIPLLNGNVESERKDSQDSIASILNGLTSESPDCYTQREASTTPSRPRLEKSSQDTIPRGLDSSTPNSYNSRSQREASTTSEPYSTRETSQGSTSSTTSTLNLTHDLEDLAPSRKASMTPQHSNTSNGSQKSTFSTASTLYVTYDLPDLELKREVSTTPQHSNTSDASQDSPANRLKNLTQELQDLNPERDASTLESCSMLKTGQAGTASIPKIVPQDLHDLGPEKETSTTLEPFSMRKTSQDSTYTTLKNPSQDLQDLQLEGETRTALQQSSRNKTTQNGTSSTLENRAQDLQNVDPEAEARTTMQPSSMNKTCQDSISSALENPAQVLENSDPEAETRTTLQALSVSKTCPDSTSSTLENPAQALQNLDPETEARTTLQPSSMSKTCQDRTATTLGNSAEDPQNSDPEKEASTTLPYPRKRRTSQDSTASSRTNLIRETESIDPDKEASAATLNPVKSTKSSQNDVDPISNSLTPNSCDTHNQKQASPIPQPSSVGETGQDSAINVRESLTQYLQTFSFKRESSATPPHPRHRRSSQNSTASSQNIVTEELSNYDSAQEARPTSLRPRKRKSSQASTVGSAKSPTRDSSNVESAKEDSVTLTNPRKKRKKESDIASAAEGSTQDLSHIDPVEDASEMPPRSRKRKKNKTNIACAPKIVTEDLVDMIVKREPSVTPPHPRKKKSTVASPLKGLTQELEKCITNVDFERLYEEIENDTESPSFTFETVQLLDDYDECNPEANKILSKILASPKSKTDKKAQRSIEPVSCGEDPLDYDPLYITEAEDNEVAASSSSKRRDRTVTKKIKNKNENIEKSLKKSKKGIDKDDTLGEGCRVDSLCIAAEPEDNEVANSSAPKTKDKTGNRKIENERTSLTNNESFEESKRSIDKHDILKEDTRCSSRSRKSRVTMTLSDWESDLSDEAAKIVKKVKAAKKKEGLSPSTLDKLDDIVVQLRHEVLPQHNIETRAGTIPLTYEQQMRFLDFASLNKDLYTPAEDEIIKRNWNAFCKDHDWDPENYGVFLQFKHGDQLIMSCMEERRKFVQFLADGLPNRPLFSVYNRFKKIYSEYADAGEWYSPEEDKKILAYMQVHSAKQPETKFAELAKVLRRSRVSIWKRYRNLKEKQNCDERTKKVSTKVEWRLPVVTDFITKLLDVTISDDLIELKDAFIPTVVWRKLENKTGIDYHFMKRSWDQQFHLQFFSPEPLSANVTKIRLIEYMWMKGIREGREIEWHVIVKYFDGCTISFLRKMFNHMTAEASTALGSRNLSHIMKWLYEVKIDRLRRSKTDHYLPRLRYVDRRVEIIPEDMTRVTLTSNQK